MISENDQIIARLVLNPPPPAKKLRQLGAMKGTVLYMAPDFDAPLEDFKEYMEYGLNLLLDTHVLLWFLNDDPQWVATARLLIFEAQGRGVNAATAVLRTRCPPAVEECGRSNLDPFVSFRQPCVTPYGFLE